MKPNLKADKPGRAGVCQGCGLAMRFFRNISIKKKLALVALLTCVTALGLACAALLINEVKVFRGNLINEVSAQGRMLAGLSTAALTFDDKSGADELLVELRGQKHIDQAIIFKEGKEFTRYQRPGVNPTIHEEPNQDGHEFHPGQIILHRQVQVKGKLIGVVCLVANTNDLQARLWQYGLILMGVFLVATFIALVLASRLQSAIATPVLRLAATAEQVAENQDYSIRAEKFGQDEVGRLTDAFNEMLARIQTQDAALNLSQQKTEALVNSIDGIVWEWDPRNATFTYISRQSERLLGYPPERWLGDAEFWDTIVHPADRERIIKARVEAMARRLPYSYEYRMLAADDRVVWIRESGVVLVEQEQPVAFRGIFLDITEQKRAAEELAKLNEQMAQTQRKAGMAEVATGVLHNVGNVLNSVNVSASLLRENVGKSQINNLIKATNLLRDHAADTVAFLANDPKGQRLPGYLIKLGDHLASEQRLWQRELEGLGKNIEHIKEIVAMQQNYARLSGVTETLDAWELVEDSLRMNESGLTRHGIKLVRDFHEVPAVGVDKHKVLQILVNLIGNAKYALINSGRNEKTLTVAIHQAGGGRVSIQVCDNGVGIAPENLIRVFQHGFTTKKEGHGFGLHSGANAAREMGGKLTVHSDGLGKGAIFTLELPLSKNGTQELSPSADVIPEPFRMKREPVATPYE